MIAVSIANGQVEIKRTGIPKRPVRFALIRLIAGGICNTDLELQAGYFGFAGTPGHEFVCEVVQADNKKWIGKRVVGEINLACGKCAWCQQGWGRHCPSRRVLGIVKHPGAFREFLTLPEANLHEVPRHIPTEEAVFVEPLAAACEILDQIQIPKSAVVAVLGDGKLGLLIGQVLRVRGLVVHQYGRHKAKLRVGQRLGIHIQVVHRNLPSAVYDYVVDATGSSGGLQQALRMVRPRGTIVLKSTLHGPVEIDTAPIIVNEVSLVGSRCGRFEPAIELLKSKRIDVASLISDQCPLADAARAFQRAAEPGVLKVLLRAG
jgi:alcohol dehydrogenase